MWFNFLDEVKIMNIDKSYFLTSNKSLFDETLKEFSTKSYQSASLNTIIQASHYNKGSFYYRFNDKFDLYISLINHVYSLQVDFIEKIIKMASSRAHISEILVYLFESQAYLYRINPSYLSLLIKFDSESDDFIKSVNNVTIPSLISTFISYLSSFQVQYMNANKVDYEVMLAIIENCYYNIAYILNFDFSQSKIVKLSEMILSMLQNPSQTAPLNNQSFEEKILRSTEDNLSVSIQEGLSLLIIEPRMNLSGKHQNERSYLFKQTKHKFDNKQKLSLLIRIKNVIQSLIHANTFKSGRQKLAFYAKLNKNEAVFTSFIVNNDLFEYLNDPYYRFSSDQRIIYHFLINLIKKEPILYLDHTIERLTDNVREVFLEFLHRLSDNHYTLVIYSSHFYNLLPIVDDVIFTNKNHILKMVSSEQLIAKYGKSTILIHYLDHGIEKTAAFNQESLNKDYLNNILLNYPIKSIQTHTQCPDEIYKLETGVTLS